MNSLFARTLMWFIVTVILTFLGMTVIAALDFDPEDRQRAPFGGMVMLQFAEARWAYENGGSAALRTTLERFRRVTSLRAVLTDASGRDLVTGEDRSDLIEAVGRRPRRPVLYHSQAVVGRMSRDGRFMFFLFLQRGGWLRWFLQPEVHLTMLVLLVMFSYAFARYLTNPVKRLQEAVECFGRGELNTRVRSNRRDEIGQLARTFDQMADRIETLLAAERRLLLDISHELRSPLARLSVALELARSDSENPKHFDRIQREIERLNALVGELLQVTRAEGDASRMLRERVDLSALIDELVADVRLEAEARGCRVEWSPGAPLITDADPELIRRAVENVVRNAIRHAPDGTGVEITASQSGNSALIQVRDYGPGVPEEHLERIFHPFYRVDTDRNRASGGVGLGLAIAKRAIELHKGRIEARQANPGLLVSIELPL